MDKDAAESIAGLENLQHMGSISISGKDIKRT